VKQTKTKIMTNINKTIEEFYDFMDEHKQNAKVLYCSATMMPIGCVMQYTDDVEHFLEWLDKDAKLYEQGELIDQYYNWREEQGNG
jgi:hypothetical protein